MIKHMYTDMADAEMAAAKPDPRGQLVSMGEQTRFETQFTKHGQRQVPVTFEVLVEWMFGGGGRRIWYRFKDNPTVLVPQFDTSPPPPPPPVEEYTDAEMAAFRAMLPPKAVPIPDPPTQFLCEQPSW